MRVHSVTFKKVNGAVDHNGRPCKKAWLNAKLTVLIDGKEVDLAISALYINKKRIACKGKGCVPPKTMIEALNTAEGIFKAVCAEKRMTAEQIGKQCGAKDEPQDGNLPDGRSSCLDYDPKIAARTKRLAKIEQ